ncbi:MAG: HEPN domain-containing protein [Christensenellales bacterium]|jgi:hypothetical protein
MAIIDGFALLSNERVIPFRFENNFLSLFLEGSPFTFEEDVKFLIGKKHNVTTGELILFHLAIPLENLGSFITKDDKVPISIGTVRTEVDFYIDNYTANSKFSKMKFSFPELDYFIPSTKMCKYFPEDSHFEFVGSPEIIMSFNFEYKGKNVTLMLKLTSVGKLSNKCHAETNSSLVFKFVETDDYDFFLALYHLVHSFFSFLCNRQNIALERAILIGKSKHKLCERQDDGTAITKDRYFPVSSEFNVINQYKENIEKSKVIAETINYCSLSSAFEGLFSLFLKGKVSVWSTHSSRAARNLLDLKQCLQITAAFEYYQRTFLPEISSDETIQVYDDIRLLIEGYADTQSGKKKKKAKRLLRTFSPTVALSEKICKVYYGYDSWNSLETILSGYFGNDNISELANIANLWRNDLAHEKREYDPDENVITAIRLVEHLNYCIVLRQAGYTDDEIKMIVDKILTR